MYTYVHTNNFLYTAPIATTSTVGMVRPGTHLAIDGSGILSVIPFYADSNVRTVLSTSVRTGLSWNSVTNKMNEVFPPSPLPCGDTEVRTLLSNSAGTGGISWNTSIYVHILRLNSSIHSAYYYFEM